ncbi:protein of unknown function DUF969 [Thermanaerovibrio acidaminovorans DSM 6589]|uniref:Permease n=1 Tax=Thermanaerovibrio acidaminovorans (strain ATCC 49978 / DSM 6589 / Su883) TaxID=525903 RepID=D1B8S1_THEAS|nr:DUF969 domain-containing protein [Thermanaerovibrio acidaminovorans]ACZ18674.1 protein of unknown function DUF969 [Thermanaerovibrio acidaminovorans DSM 6589]
MIKLVGVVIVVVGLLLRFNPLLVVLVAGFATGLVGGMGPMEVLEALGNAFVTNRYMSLFVLTLPVIGVLERHGLKEQAERFVSSLKGATAGRVMMLYMLFRQLTCAVGLQLGGHPTFVRPIVAPMAEGALSKGGELDPDLSDRVRAMAASAENYGNFFGQLIFIASGGLLLIKGVMDQAGHPVDLMRMGMYAVPTAVCAFAMAALRFHLFDLSAKRDLERGGN